MQRLRFFVTAALLTLAATFAVSCERQGFGWEIYDFNRECRMFYEGHPPPGARAWRCDRYVDLDSVFVDEEERCWVRTYCPNIYDLPQYQFRQRCDLVFEGVADDWPWCPEGARYRPSSPGPRR